MRAHGVALIFFGDKNIGAVSDDFTPNYRYLIYRTLVKKISIT